MNKITDQIEYDDKARQLDKDDYERIGEQLELLL